MIATYVDDFLIWSKDPMSLIKEFQKIYTLKSIGYPEYYLGGDILHPIDGTWSHLNIHTAILAQTYINDGADKPRQVN